MACVCGLPLQAFVVRAEVDVANNDGSVDRVTAQPHTSQRYASDWREPHAGARPGGEMRGWRWLRGVGWHCIRQGVAS